MLAQDRADVPGAAGNKNSHDILRSACHHGNGWQACALLRDEVPSVRSVFLQASGSWRQRGEKLVHCLLSSRPVLVVVVLVESNDSTVRDVVPEVGQALLVGLVEIHIDVQESDGAVGELGQGVAEEPLTEDDRSPDLVTGESEPPQRRHHRRDTGAGKHSWPSDPLAAIQVFGGGWW